MENLPLVLTACLTLCLVPGVDMAFLLSTSVARGRKAGTIAAVGINVGGYAHLIAATLGLSVVLMTSATAFLLVKWAGALYMIYLGITALFAKGSRIALTSEEVPARNHSSRKTFWQGFLSDLFNPKVAIFYLSFLPQFVSHSSPNPAVDILLLGVILNVICLAFNLLLVQSAGAVSKKLRTSKVLARWLNRVMGITFIGIGIRIAAEKRPV